MLKRILGLLGWLGVALVLGAVTIWFLQQTGRVATPAWDRARFWLAAGGLVCTLLYMLSQWREVARSFSGREAKFGTVAVVSAVVVLAILIAINYLGVRHNKRWDLTAAKQFTLSEQTRKILGGLQKPVAIKVFATPNDFQRFRDRLDEYQYASKQVSIEYIDVDKYPSRAQQYQVQQVGTVVFDYGGRTERVTSDGEQELTNGLIKVLQGKQNKVYFVQGHGERSTDASAREGYSTISSSLTSENFAVDKLVLAQQKEVPADASVVIVAGPKTDLFAPEIDMIKRYLAKGGKVFFLLDPPEKEGSGEIPGISALLKDWGIEVGNNVVVDVSGMGQLLGTGPETPVAAKYQSHPITDRFELLTAYRLARSVAPITGGTSGKFPQTLVETSANSWGETDVKLLISSGQVKRDLDKGDKAGPVSLAAAVSAPATDTPPPPAGAKPEDANTNKPETRIVVFGDSDFASNGWLGIQGNRDLFLNTVNWLAQQENLISIRPRDPENRGITLTAGQQELIFYVTVLFIPGVILLAGVFTWWRRR
jgi:ABC-type uncharacterized transport system involved in gliding motility auxiliary subunit